MLGAIKEIPDTIKGWSENREQLYNLVASVAAALVIAASLTGVRPSESLAVVARGMGLFRVAERLTTTAPPFLTARTEVVSDVSLLAVLLLLTGMVVVPLLRGWRDDNDMFAYELLPLLGAPSAGTTWLLLLVAAQYGDIVGPLHAWAETGPMIVGWTSAGLGVVGLIYLIASRYGRSDLARFLLQPPVVIAYRLFIGVGFAGFAVILSAVLIPLSIIGWFIGLQSDRHRKFRAKMEHERLDRQSVATGAAIVRLDLDPVA